MEGILGYKSADGRIKAIVRIPADDVLELVERATRRVELSSSSCPGRYDLYDHTGQRVKLGRFSDGTWIVKGEND